MIIAVVASLCSTASFHHRMKHYLKDCHAQSPYASTIEPQQGMIRSSWTVRLCAE